MRTWPLKPREREPNGQCVHYDPRDRPWFKSATSEPKKVVIIVQASGRGEPLNNMEGYFQYLALAVERHLGGANEPVLFSPLYEDASGLGIMTTVSQPIFVNPRCAERNSTVGRLLLGIVAKDITLDSLLEAGLTQQMVETMIRESLGSFRRCNEDYKYAHCKMQTIRGAATECPHRLWNASMAETDMCYRFKGRHYLLRAEPKGFLSAAQSCTAIGGRLVELSDEGEGEGDQQHFLASIVPPDGAWIGLRPSAESAGWQWVGSMRQVNILHCAAVFHHDR
eukprot:evm.model.scf_276.2 EVM.evm.TU.scf_276.2   scf_276:4684-11230(-)